MNGSKRVLIALLAGIVAVVCVVAYGWSLKQESGQAHAQAIGPYGKEIQEVYRAKTDIPAGSSVEEGLVEKVAWPSALLPAGVVTRESELKGVRARTLIKQNEPISLERLSGEGGGLQIPKGFTALTVPSDDTLGVGGALSPGSRVDVYSVAGGGATLLGTSIVVVETSALSEIAAKSSARASLSWVTLAVKDDSVEEMLAASSSGTLYLTLPSLEGD